jgi:hypothetical protein
MLTITHATKDLIIAKKTSFLDFSIILNSLLTIFIIHEWNQDQHKISIIGFYLSIFLLFEY